MNNFKGGGGFKKGGGKFGSKPKFGGGDRRSGGGNKFGGKNDRDERSSEKFKATCSECGKSCEVPFRPSSDKPVYCSECFGMRLSEENRGEKRGGRNERPDYTKLPREQRPPRHDARGKQDGSLADVQRQLSKLEEKLNRILELINPPMPSAKVPLSKSVISTDKKPKAKKAVVKKTVAKKVAKKATKKTVKKVAKKTTKKVVKK